jgi:hypothetical protein
MTFVSRLHRPLAWLNLPASLLIAFLQRSPALPTLGVAGSMTAPAPLGAVLRSALVGTASLGALHSMAGATRATSPIPPAITTQPLGQTVTAGSSLVIWVIATGSPAPTYQWRKDGANIPAANAYYLSLSNLQTGNAGTYTVVVSNALGSVTSAGAVVNVNAPPAPPTITTQPAGQSATVGANVSFTAAASGNPAPAFQWQKNGASLAGATNASLTLVNVQLGDAGVYSVVTSNSAGSATSGGATLLVNPAAVAPVITLPPANVKATEGTGVTFTASASGLPAPTYQWRKGGAALPGATGSSLTLAHVRLGDAGIYSVVANNSAGSVTSTGALLTVSPAPITTRLGDFDGDGKADVLLTNTVTGERAIWLMNGAAIRAGASVGVLPAAWSVSGLGDFDGDGQADILLTNTVTGDRAIWLMHGTTIAAGMDFIVLPTAWAICGTGDFDGDGQCDILLRNTTTGDVAIWLMHGASIAAGADLGPLAADWRISDTGDFDGDGKADLFLTNQVTGERALWLMNGTGIRAGASLGVLSTDWLASGAGDFNGDGRTDLLFTNTVTGDRALWFLNGAAVSGVSLGVLPTEWSVSGTGDFDGDGKCDLILTNTVTGDRAIWLLNGAAVSGSSLGVVATDWLITH